jgi:hypothetical protein
VRHCRRYIADHFFAVSMNWTHVVRLVRTFFDAAQGIGTAPVHEITCPSAIRLHPRPRAVRSQGTLQPGDACPEGSKMNLRRWFLLANMLPLVLAEAAYAATIFTPPVIPDDDGTFFCLVTNVSTKTLVVQIEVFDANGERSRRFGFTTPPLHTRAAFGLGASGDRFCRVTVDGGRSVIRASVEVLSASSAIEAVYPVP